MDTLLKEDIKRRKTRDYYLQRTYGISLDEYNELLEKQDHKCFVCERHEDEFDTNLAVDHDHKTMEIRGLLCNYCNHRRVGRHRLDAVPVLEKVIQYLRGPYTGWFVPKKKRKR